MSENDNKERIQKINDLALKVMAGDNDAWTQLYSEMDAFVHFLAWDMLKGMFTDDTAGLEEELYQAGWVGCMKALRGKFDPKVASFSTYAARYITEEMRDELFDIQFNSLGFTERPKPSANKNSEMSDSRVKIVRILNHDDSEALEEMIAGALQREHDPGLTAPEPDDVTDKDYSTERRALQIVDLLRLLTDEEHSLSSAELRRFLDFYRMAKYGKHTRQESDNTFNKSMAEVLLELDPDKHTENNDSEYRIRYDGFDKDYLAETVIMKDDNPLKVDRALVINGLSYVHDFDNETLDKLIQLVSFSDMFSGEDKTKIIRKLMDTASVYYKTPFMDGDKRRFNPGAIHGRFSGKDMADRGRLSENIKIIQDAINNLGQIRFRFNRYTADHSMLPRTDSYHHLSPYHIVVYHDNYYCIGLKHDDPEEKRIWHYRIDLMSDIEIVRENGRIVPIKIKAFEGLPICNDKWDPEKYMAEHLNMAFGDVRDIRIKIRDNDYTIIHDWFGDHYRKVSEINETDADGNEVRYDIVEVTTSPRMLIHWAMQYGTLVEIMDEEVREKISEEINVLGRLYG